MTRSPRAVATNRAGAAILALVALASCSAQPREDEAESSHAGVQARSLAILTALRDRDPQALARFVHPDKGVRFSPYAFVDVATDRVLRADRLAEAWSDPSTLLWGVADGSGDPLEMSAAAYFERFVYDADFLHAERIAIDERIGRGNTLDNAREVYPAATLVEYHFSGFDPRHDGLDWRSLRLVLEEADGQWFLVGVIHDQWTI